MNVPELRADHLFRIEEEGVPPWELQVEYQIEPDPRQVPGWIAKNAALNHQRKIPVVLLVIYLRKGDRTRFPESHVVEAGGLKNEHRFETVRLWEHRERIRTGDLRELAPLLVLCEDNPTESTLREERQIIQELPVTREAKEELHGLALMLGSGIFSAEVLRKVFIEEQNMLGTVDEKKFLEEVFPEALAELKRRSEESGEKRGEKRGEVLGEVSGQIREARRLALVILRVRFQDLPSEISEQVEGAGTAWCEALVEFTVNASSLQEVKNWIAAHPDHGG